MNQLNLTGRSLKVEIPNYLTRLQVSKAARAKYWGIDDKDKIPQKYQTPQYGWKSGKLFDTYTEELVMKNPKAAGNPRFVTIAGNEIMRMHQAVWAKLVLQLKQHFEQHIKDQIPPMGHGLAGPVSIQMTLYRSFGLANDDMDNLWFYHKCFNDAFVDVGIIANDNIIHVRQSGQTTFVPIREGETPRMEFLICEVDMTEERNQSTPVTLVQDFKIEPGDIKIERIGEMDYIRLGVGRKKIIFGAAKNAIRKAMYHCLNNFKTPMVDKELYSMYDNFFTCFAEHRITIIKINNDTK